MSISAIEETTYRTYHIYPVVSTGEKDIERVGILNIIGLS